MVSRSKPPLSKYTNNFSWHQTWFARRQGHYWKTEGEKAGPYKLFTRLADGKRSGCCEIPGMFSSYTKGTKNSFWWGNQGSPLPSNEQAEEKRSMPATINFQWWLNTRLQFVCIVSTLILTAASCDTRFLLFCFSFTLYRMKFKEGTIGWVEYYWERDSPLVVLDNIFIPFPLH